MDASQQSGERKAGSCPTLKYVRHEVLPRNTNCLFDFHGHFRRYAAVSVLQTAGSRFGNTDQLAQLGARKTVLLPVFPQNSMRFSHNDTYGIAPRPAKSIPIVSDAHLAPVYPLAMAKNKDPWKSWGLRLRNHLKESGKNLAYIAERMPNRDGEPMNESTIRSWTNGTRKINLVDFITVCEIGEADPAVILFGHPIMSEEQKKRIGGIVMSALEADPSANPDYGDTMTKIRIDAKRRNIGKAK